MDRIWLWGAIILVLLQFSLSEKVENKLPEKNVKVTKRDIDAFNGYDYPPYFNEFSVPFSYYSYNQSPWNLQSPKQPKFHSPPPTLTATTPSPAAEIQCGDVFRKRCRQSRYRTYDGSCNNLYQPTWGMANTRYGRLLPANYADGIHAPTLSTSGHSLPLARRLSYTFSPDIHIPDKQFTLAAMQYGQIITHDLAMIDGSTQSTAHPTRCCTTDGQLIPEATNSPLCYPILLAPDDPVYGRTNMKCKNFVRSNTDLDRGCSSPHEPAEQLTTVTHFLDLSIVYGSSDDIAASLRAGVGGRLMIDVRGNREWLPSAQNKSASCGESAQVCYRSGDTRVNQNPQLTVLHTILLREHNRVATILSTLNPHWSDETIFQETRRIVIAEHQHISYYEWLPLFIGLDNSHRHRINYNTKGYVNDYDYSVNPSVLNEHSTAAFRYFHSLIAGNLDLVGESRSSYPSPSFNSLRLSDHFNDPKVLEQNNNFDDLTRGLGSQPEEQADPFYTKEVTNLLFRRPNQLGSDLRSIDIQRNRDHGLASYNNYRKFCGLRRAVTWNDFLDYISSENVQKLSQLYESVDDVDLTVAGILESHIPGTLVGPTFLCILTEQFYRTRVGDRYWFESYNSGAPFTVEQLNQIRRSSISRLFCDNGDNIQSMQSRGFERLSTQNPLVNCKNLPGLDLTLWKDYTPQSTVAQQSPYFK